MEKRSTLSANNNFNGISLHVLSEKADKDLQEHMKRVGRLPKPQMSTPDAKLWPMAEEEEIGRLRELGTFEVVPRPREASVAGSRDIFNLKETPTRTGHKNCIVAGGSRRLGVWTMRP
ncbi:hypothetical protein HK102_002317 [Quaeritorhiza haematococci]|nr:hypothetical protein HK102_002317 [Quaeritorhiza haematococci]